MTTINALIAQGRVQVFDTNVTQLQPSVRGYVAKEHLEHAAIVYGHESEVGDEVLGRWVLGRLQYEGPMSAEQLSDLYHVDDMRMQIALAKQVSVGKLIEGQFDKRTAEKQWVDRRILARIHRLHGAEVRQRYKAVDSATFWQFLLSFQYCAPKAQLMGSSGVKHIVEQLEGYPLTIGSFEQDILPTRVVGYEPQLLDESLQNGELTWLPLRSLETTQAEQKIQGLSQSSSIVFFKRESLNSAELEVVPPSIEVGRGGLEHDVFMLLSSKGALFRHEITATLKRLPTEILDALKRLCASGYVASDGMASLRLLQADRLSKVYGLKNLGYEGRWRIVNQLPDKPMREYDDTNETHQELLRVWAQRLLKRYGVVFKDLLQYEPLAPSWGSLRRIFREMEWRGQLIGGRFVEGVSGEQYAERQTLDDIQTFKDRWFDEAFVVLSAADPLNLSGLLGKSQRIASNRLMKFVLFRGQVVAKKDKSGVEFLQEFKLDEKTRMERSLQLHAKYRHVDPWSTNR
jgi:ATP-dependent Lhr-like helicase